MSCDRDLKIGREILAARRRDPPVRWKILMRKYKLGRARLNQLWRLAREEEARAAGGGKSVYRHLSPGRDAHGRVEIAAD